MMVLHATSCWVSLNRHVVTVRTSASTWIPEHAPYGLLIGLKIISTLSYVGGRTHAGPQGGQKAVLTAGAAPDI